MARVMADTTSNRRPYPEETKLFVQWAAQHVQKITEALYSGRLDEANTLQIAAMHALEAATLPDDVVEALGYLLLFLHHNIRWVAQPEAWTSADYLEVKQVFAQPAHTSFGDFERVKRLIYIRFRADQDQLDLLNHDDLMMLLDELQGCYDDVIWFNVAGWAFNHRDLPLMERAYTESLTDPSPWMGQAKWLRVNLMYLLLAGRASPRDVEETIKSIAILPQLIEFEMLIWPRCIEAGLADANLTAMLEQRANDIRQAPPTPPGHEPRTKRVRRNLLR
jgi:hypothetical protein